MDWTYDGLIFDLALFISGMAIGYGLCCRIMVYPLVEKIETAGDQDESDHEKLHT